MVHGSNRGRVGLLLGVMIWVGMTLIVWGVDDIAGFLSHPARSGLMAFILLFSARGLVLHLQPSSAFSKGEKMVGSQRLTLAVFAVMCTAILVFLPYLDRHEVLVFSSQDWVRYLGLVLMVAGGTMRVFSAQELGRQFSIYVTLQENHKLVQSGVFGVIRHPLYLGAAIMTVGMGLIYRTWLIIPMSVLILVFILSRIQNEEKLLAEHFKEEFVTYRRHTWRLIPYIY